MPFEDHFIFHLLKCLYFQIFRVGDPNLCMLLNTCNTFSFCNLKLNYHWNFTVQEFHLYTWEHLLREWHHWGDLQLIFPGALFNDITNWDWNSTTREAFGGHRPPPSRHMERERSELTYFPVKYYCTVWFGFFFYAPWPWSLEEPGSLCYPEHQKKKCNHLFLVPLSVFPKRIIRTHLELFYLFC